LIFDVDDASAAEDGRPVLRGLSFGIRPGERVVVLGVNGCGKTTLLKLLDGLIFTSGGSVRYDGLPLHARALDDARFRRRFRAEVGFLFQNVDAMLFNPTVADEIAFGPRQLGLDDVAGRVSRWAEAFGVTPFLERAPFELSGGEKKRVALAALLAAGPRVLLLDEATANLDPAWAGRLVDLLAELRDLTVVAATHNVTVAEELGARAILLAPGRPGVLFDSSPADLFRNQAILVESGLAHRHAHRHRGEAHAHFHVHDAE
jgi:cobalt/nickel transport system ATP-binding protein